MADFTEVSEPENLTVLTIGDPHFKVSNVLETDVFSQKLLDLIELRNPDLVVCLGDTLDTHEKIHVDPLVRAIELFDKIRKLTKLVVIIGNHDRRNNSDFLSEIHPFTALKKWENTLVADHVVEDVIKGHRMIFVPYVPPGNFESALSRIGNYLTNDGLRNSKPIIMAHQEFYGCKMGAIISKDGDQWPTNYPLVISGHIHDYQRPQDNIIYTGTPLQHAFGDSTDKTINIYTFDGDNFEEDRVDLGLPKRRTYYISAEEALFWEPPTDGLIRLVIKGTTSELKTFNKSKKSKELKKLVTKLVLKPINDETIEQIELQANKPYSEVLYETISDEPELIELYHELFSNF